MYNDRYLILESADREKLAVIHIKDNDVAVVMGKQPGGDVYGGDPFVVRNLSILRAFLKAMQETMEEIYVTRSL